MRRVVRLATIAAMWAVLFSGGILLNLMLSVDGKSAVMRDRLMEPAVPMGAVVVMHDGADAEPGDVTAYYPGRVAPIYTLDSIQMALFEQAVVRRVVQETGAGTMEVAADARPDLAPEPVGMGDYDAVQYYFPLVGYLFWFGPLGIAVSFAVGLTIVHLTRRPVGSGSVGRLLGVAGLVATATVLAAAAPAWAVQCITGQQYRCGLGPAAFVPLIVAACIPAGLALFLVRPRRTA